MKKLVNFVFLSVFTLVLFSCSTDGTPLVNSFDVEDDILYETVYVDLVPSKGARSLDVNAETFTAKLGYSPVKEEVVSVEASDELLRELGINNTEFSAEFFEQLELEYEATGKHRDCFQSCKELERGEGRGACKFGCWVDIAKDVIDAIASIKKIFD